MADKEIIINDIDVGECDFFSKGITHNICENLKEVEVECKYNSSCYFKQLKRKEQECEELKEKINKYSKINEQDTKDFAKYSNALNEIEKIVNTDYYQDSWGTLAIKVDNIKGIINKVKEENQCEQ